MKRDSANHCTTYAMILKQLFIDRSWIVINTGVFLREMCSDRRKNHGCREKILEDTSSAMFHVRTIARCCEFERCALTRFDVKRVTQVTVLLFFLGKCVRTAAKTMVVDRKIPEGTSSARFGLRTAKCGELKRCAVGSRTDNLR